MPTAEGREGAGLATEAPTDLEQFFAATQRAAYSLGLRIAGSPRLAEEATAAAYRALSRPYDEAALMELVRIETLRLAGASGSQEATAAVVRAAFESLDQLQRGALELAHSGGMSVAQIAATLGAEPGNVRAALRSALLKLGAAATNRGGSA